MPQEFHRIYSRFLLRTLPCSLNLNHIIQLLQLVSLVTSAACNPWFTIFSIFYLVMLRKHQQAYLLVQQLGTYQKNIDCILSTKQILLIMAVQVLKNVSRACLTLKLTALCNMSLLMASAPIGQAGLLGRPEGSNTIQMFLQAALLIMTSCLVGS